MKSYSILLIALLAVSCNNSNSNKTADTTSIKNEAETSSSGLNCYRNITGKDTAILVLIDPTPANIGGSLQYKYYEKDENSGTISGKMYGDTLIAEYVFGSEGKTSIRDVAFLKHGSAFIEGYADMKEENGKTTFKNRSAIQFTGQPLTRFDCIKGL